jgi:lipoprotein-anchoring transpeptidase ErfK/SrfK
MGRERRGGELQARSRNDTARRLRQVAARAEAANAARKRESARRLAVLLTVAAASVVVVTTAALASPRPAVRGATATARNAQRSTTATTNATRTAPLRQAGPAPTTAQPLPSYPLTLTALDRQSCPAKATACVDLTRHLTWLQSAGRITFGPIRAEPGPPGSAHATPRGIFEVSWKAGPDFVSNIYHEPMPWAVFFAPGGIAFHGGSLTTPSHGCVHLTDQNARYYNQHLPDGAEVVVF